MKPEDKLPKTFDWKFSDGSVQTMTREELVAGFKLGDMRLQQIRRDKGIKK